MTDKKFEVAGNVSIVPTGQKTVSKEAFETAVDNVVPSTTAGAGDTLTDMYDRFSKLIYAIDASGSMGEGMLSDESIKMYKWSPELLEKFMLAMEKDKYFEKQWKEDQKEMAEEYEEDGDAFEEDGDAFEGDGSSPVDVRSLTEAQLKMEIVSENLSQKYGVPLEVNYSFNNRNRSRSKMMALKDAAKNFVHSRFQKFADARVGVFSFEDSPSLLCAAGASEEEVMQAINRLPDNGGGGTNIYRAVERVVNECKKRPSEVGLHHIVLVSDGCDYGGIQVKNLLPKMKELGIVFDFIYMIGASGDVGNSEEVAKVLREVCEATGGEYTIVKTEEDFEKKFLAVSKRPLLPAPK